MDEKSKIFGLKSFRYIKRDHITVSLALIPKEYVQCVAKNLWRLKTINSQQREWKQLVLLIYN